MGLNFIYIFLFDCLILVFIALGAFWFLKKLEQKVQKKVGELVACEREKENVYEAISGLTALSGVNSALDYIAENLQKLGFSKILIFVVDKKAQVLKAKIALGFERYLNLRDLDIPISSYGGLINQTLFRNEFYVVEDAASKLPDNLEFKNNLGVGSFMAVPIVKKNIERCWETFNCTFTTCPAYENEDSYCWTVPETKCAGHLKNSSDERIFSNPASKIKACLNCEAFQSLGVMLVADKEFIKFSENDKKLFRTFAYEAGAKLERAFLLSHLEERERELTKRMYEISILKELGERIGYSLNIQKIADIITSSLGRLIDYSAASYILIDPDRKKPLFKCQLEEAVNRSFVDTVKKRMLAGLSALTGKDLKLQDVEESLVGTILDETKKDLVRSFFNIPLTLGEKVAGMLNVSSTRSGLYREDEMTILYKITVQASNAVTRLNEVLASEQEKLNAMVSSMADGVLMVNKENQIQVINPRVAKMLGLKKEGISIFDIFDSFTDKVNFRTKLEESIKMDRLVIIDEVYLNNNFLRILFSPVKNQAGEILGAVTIFHDITPDKEIEKMREDFTHMMVHDLRSPLSGIRLMAELAQKDEQPRKELIDSFRLVHQTSSSMLELVNDLLDVAKIESGKFIVNKQLDNLPEVIQGKIDFFKRLAQDKNINLTTQIARNLPPVKFDRKEIEQVLNNLLANSLKFTASGGNVIIQALPYIKAEDIEKKALASGINWFITSKNKTLADWNKSGIICAVTDSGYGISKDQIPKLFNKFEQAESARKSKSKGTGLGLVIFKGIIEAHGGVVGVESKVDQGSTFFFILPLE